MELSVVEGGIERVRAHPLRSVLSAVTLAFVSDRKMTVHRGKHFGWWVVGRHPSGSLFMMTWWPTEGLARLVGGWFGEVESR